MGEKKVRITIDNKGDFKLEALEGFSGQSCIQKTKTIEMALGGMEVSSGKTDDYYNPEDDSSVSISFD